MNFKFLGTGAATAVPLPFCKCTLCEYARKNGGHDKRKRSSLLINDDLLIDLSPDLMSAAFAYGLDTSKIRYLLQTHSHCDHFDAGHMVTRMEEYASVAVPPLTVVASETTLAHMWAQMVAQESSIDLSDPHWHTRLNLTPHCISQNGQWTALGKYSVLAIDSDHDVGDGSMNYVLRDEKTTLLYALDSKGLSQGALDLFVAQALRLDLVILDHTYGYGINSGGHLDGDGFVATIQALKAVGILSNHCKIYASHISHEGNLPHHEFESKAREQGYLVAYDGLELIL